MPKSITKKKTAKKPSKPRNVKSRIDSYSSGQTTEPIKPRPPKKATLRKSSPKRTTTNPIDNHAKIARKTSKITVHAKRSTKTRLNGRLASSLRQKNQPLHGQKVQKKTH